ncbi:CopG family antitoxin [Phormidesmis sp. 146-33]
MLNESGIEENKTSISNANSYEEIGEFWDTHSLDDYWEQTQPVEFIVNLGSNKTYYSLDANLAEQVKAIAQRQGISPEKLLASWIQEKLRETA